MATQKLRNVEAVEGWKVHLDVRFICYPFPEVEWYRGNTKIRTEGRFQVSQMPDEGLYSLIISKVRKEDTGSYRCVAKNSAGEATSRAELVVRDKDSASAFSEGKPRPMSLLTGEELNLHITEKDEPELTWYKNGIRVEDTDRINIRSLGDKHYLTIPSVTFDDSGLYKCEAVTDLGTSFHTFDVQIQDFSKGISQNKSISNTLCCHTNTRKKTKLNHDSNTKLCTLFIQGV